MACSKIESASSDFNQITVFVEIERNSGISGDFARKIFHVINILHFIDKITSSERNFCGIQLPVEPKKINENSIKIQKKKNLNQKVQGDGGKYSPQGFFFYKTTNFNCLFPLAALAEVKQNFRIGRGGITDLRTIFSSNGQ